MSNSNFHPVGWLQSSTLALLAWACLPSGAARADFLVSPSAITAVEGGTALNVIIDQASMSRYQQVYAASEFASIGGPIRITQIAFRPNASQVPFTYLVPEIQFNLSTTSVQPRAMSLTFANNVGPDDTIVFAPGPLNFTSAVTGPIGGPKDFDIVVPLTTPFVYDPSVGNLLMDVRHISNDLPLFNIALDADQFQLTSSHLRGSGTAENLALATRFEFTPQAVPAPPAAMLAVVGCLTLLGYRRRKT